MARRDFYLISKPTRILFAQYKGKAQRLSNELPHTVEEIIVGRRGVKGQRIITTFRDSKGEIIERSYDYPKRPLRNVVYTHSDYVIGEDEYVKTTTKKEYTIYRTVLKRFKEIKQVLSDDRNKIFLCVHQKTESNHLSENIHTGEKILSRTSIVNLENLGKQIHRFIEFPHVIGGKIKKYVTKFLYFEVDDTSGKVIQDSIFSDGIKFHRGDQFLQFRAYDIDGVKEPATRKFMRDRKVDKLGVNVNTTYIPKDDKEKTRLVACFIPSNGSVNFNMLYKPKSKTMVIGTARHEVEHIWHYLLDARNGDNEIGTWQNTMFERFGPIVKNKTLQIEANRCSDAIENYVEFTEDYQAYLKNYIEEEANREGRLVREKYDRQGEKLRKSLPHIPKELL
ncbi:hypothetical protein J6A34_01465 [bacterium]|nr:hypothetical protein [bacterium]